MFTLVVCDTDRAPRVMAFQHLREVTIGRTPDNDVVLPVSNVSKRHARIVLKDERYIIVDLKSTNGTYVNGVRIKQPLVIRGTDEIRIGQYTISLADADDAQTVEGVPVPYEPADPTEKALLEAIAHGDETSREVYADWLEQRGDAARAEFLRVQQAIVGMTAGDPDFVPASRRLRQLATGLTVPWRVQVARPVVEGCDSIGFELQCPREWGGLAPSLRPGVRHCETCRKHVHYCASVGEARRHARLGNCVALDIASARWDGDLDPPFNVACASCGLDIGDRARTCPRCGAAVARAPVMMMGMVLPGS